MSDDQSGTFRQTDVLDPARAQALFATLGQDRAVAVGDALPPFFHQIYFWSALPPDLLGRDGHPARGQGVVPDMGLPRRMWAGGRLTFHNSLRAGVSATCNATLLSATEKKGRSGALGLVTVGYRYLQDGVLCIEEERDLIYRADPDPADLQPKPLVAARDEIFAQSVEFSRTLLFRYSALTFNGHRIHYDADYAQNIEGYAGLVVHGPLLAQHLMLFAEQNSGPLRGFQFRATAPLMDFEKATLCQNGHRLWVRGPDGRQCMQAEIAV